MSHSQNSAETSGTKTGIGNTGARLVTKEVESFKTGWLAPYIEHDLTKSLRSSEKVELWLRAHFSHPIGEQLADYVQENDAGLQYGERTPAAESVLTSLAALVISSGIMTTVGQDEEGSRK